MWLLRKNQTSKKSISGSSATQELRPSTQLIKTLKSAQVRMISRTESQTIRFGAKALVFKARTLTRHFQGQGSTISERSQRWNLNRELRQSSKAKLRKRFSKRSEVHKKNNLTKIDFTFRLKKVVKWRKWSLGNKKNQVFLLPKCPGSWLKAAIYRSDRDRTSWILMKVKDKTFPSWFDILTTRRQWPRRWKTRECIAKLALEATTWRSSTWVTI